MSENVEEGFGIWAILELMGHVKVSGYVTEEELFGSKLGRIDVPADDERETVTQYFGGQSVYRLTPVSEDVARAFARRSRPQPVQVYELALPEPRPSAGYPDHDDPDIDDFNEHDDEDWF